MPYSNLRDLPPTVKKLGVHEQQIWQGAFNSAFKNYKVKNDKKYDKEQSEAANRERYAAAVAWSSVNSQRGVRSAG